MITKIVKYIWIFIVSNISIVYAFFALLFLFSLSYLFGHKILDGSQFVGGDSTFALSLAYWFERWWPRIPLWFPLQGNGVSLFHSYPMGTTFLVLFLHHYTSLSLVVAFRLLAFMTFPLTAVGIYLFCWTRLKNQTVGLLAGTFFLLSQASWIFQTMHGIFAQSFSMIFFPPIFLSFDIYCEKIKKGIATTFWGRSTFFITILLLGLLYWVHVVSGVLISIFLLFYVFVLFMMEIKMTVVQRIFLTLKAALPILVLGFALTAFWLIPYFSYNGLANREGLLTKNIGQMQEESLRIPTLLGIGQAGVDPYRYDFFFFATPVLILFGVGILLAIITRSKKAIALCALVLFAVYNTMAALLTPWIVMLFTYFFTATYFRALIPAFIFLPIIAALGAYYVPAGVINLIMKGSKKFFSHKIKQSIFGKSAGFVFTQVTNIIIAVLTILIGWYFITNFVHEPPKTRIGQFHAFGPSIDEDNILLNEKSLKSLLQIPNVTIKELEPGDKVDVDYLVNILHLTNASRLDISPFAYGGALLKSLPMYTDASFINLYHYFASITHAMWGYEQGVFYSKIALYKEPILVQELTKWFGLEKLIITHNWDPEDKYQKAGWVAVDKEKGLWEYPQASGLFSVTSRPAILVIGDYKHGGYEQVFRSANLGAILYDDAWIVEGTNNIDSYSAEELKKFRGIILHGYTYGFGSNAWSKLQQYAEQGGKVFVETGWQYVAKDWGNGNSPNAEYALPSVLPVTKTHWSNIGIKWDDTVINSEIAPDASLAAFDPPVWNNSPWGMAIAKKQDLRSGAVPILSKGDDVFMAMQTMRNGEIVWSGMNIFSHITQKMNKKEADFLGSVMKSLFALDTVNDTKPISYTRTYPDTVNFTINEPLEKDNWLLFRESYSPNWQAHITQGNKAQSLRIWRAGPGFLLIQLPQVSVGDTVTLSYTLGLKDGLLAILVSVITLIGIIVYLVLGNRIYSLLNKIGIIKSVMHRIKNPFRSFKKTLTEEENY
jgi:hypothetical protein